MTKDPRFGTDKSPYELKEDGKADRRFKAEGRAGDDAFRIAAFEEGERRNQYVHKVVCTKEPSARME